MAAARWAGFVVSVLAGAHPADAATADPNPVELAQAGGELQPYDAGFAFKASQACPGLTMLIPMGPDAAADEGFKRGVAMFEHYEKLQTLDGACKAALKLYDSTTGKAAKVLGRK